MTATPEEFEDHAPDVETVQLEDIARFDQSIDQHDEVDQ